MWSCGQRGFDPGDIAARQAIITVAAPYTNAHRCNNRVRRIGDLLVEAIAERGGQGLLVGSPAVSDARTQVTPNAAKTSTSWSMSSPMRRQSYTQVTGARIDARAIDHDCAEYWLMVQANRLHSHTLHPLD
jgi:dihydroxyacid dehydratase/phosphogluconate dehydratase